jgi:carbon monoxide dehydrogenase subunit G
VRVEKQTTVAAPPEQVWAFLWDVERVARCIPGCSDVRVVDPQRSYTATVTEKVGPFRVSFPLEIEVTRLEAPRNLQVQARGADS